MGIVTSEHVVNVNGENYYSLARAERILREKECQMEGHTFSVMAVLGSAEPATVYCERCGETWNVATRS